MNKSHSQLNASPARALLGRGLRLFLKEAPAALLIAALLGLFCAFAATALSHGADSGYTLAPLAVVDEDGTFASGLSISLIARQDFTAPLDIVKTDGADAQEGLETGRFCAALYLPQGFTQDVLGGVQSQARLVLSESTPVQADVIRLLCDFGQELLRTGQYGVFAGERLVLEAAPERHGSYLKKSNTLFLTKAMSDPGIQITRVGYARTGLEAGDWYLALYAAAFFLLLALGCSFVSRDLEPGLLRRMYACGVKPGAILASRFVIILLFYLLLAGGLLAILGRRFTVLGLGTLVGALCSLALTGMALNLCLHRQRSAAALTALAAVGLCASGGILPRMESCPGW